KVPCTICVKIKKTELYSIYSNVVLDTPNMCFFLTKKIKEAATKKADDDDNDDDDDGDSDNENESFT
ncbi:hypothetical protein NPS74_23410, partial [Cutibacterium acnes subsp. acnes]|nr:hypothetical protein [Cutibacterium acnes subsp. acnes]